MEAHARTTDPATSHEAAAAVNKDHAKNLRRRVLQVLMAHGPIDDTRLCAFLVTEGTPSGVRTRRNELVKAGMVRDTGRRVTLKTNRQAIVWEATQSAL